MAIMKQVMEILLTVALKKVKMKCVHLWEKEKSTQSKRWGKKWQSLTSVMLDCFFFVCLMNAFVSECQKQYMCLAKQQQKKN